MGSHVVLLNAPYTAAILTLVGVATVSAQPGSVFYPEPLVANARANAAQYSWAKAMRQATVDAAAPWMKMSVERAAYGMFTIVNANMVKGMVDYFATANGHKENRINLIPGYVEPSDMEEIKRIAGELGVNIIMFPDTSNVLNGPQTGKYHMYPAGGTPVADLIRAGSSQGTVALGPLASGPAARALDTKCKVPCEILNLPIGLMATDTFIDTLRRIAGVTVPDSLNIERGRLLDVITDMHQYFFGRKVALAGDPDQLISLSEFLVSIDMWPVHIVTGTPGWTCYCM